MTIALENTPETPGHSGSGFTRPYNKGARVMNAIVFWTCIFFAGLAITLLVCIFGFVTYKGIANVNWALFANLPVDDPSGLRSAIGGTLFLILMASVVGVPMGVLCGVYLAEFTKDNLFSRTIRLVVDVLAGTPSIIVGVLGYQLLVMGWKPIGYFANPHFGQTLLNALIWIVNGFIEARNALFPTGYSAWAGMLALAFMMIPVIARTTEEMLKLVPKAYREASVGVGASKSQTLFRVTLPAARAGIITGIMLALARIAGETAPLYFTTFVSNQSVMYISWIDGFWKCIGLLLIPVAAASLIALIWNKKVALVVGGIGLGLVTLGGIIMAACGIHAFPLPAAHTNEKFPNLTVQIYENAISEKPALWNAAWGGLLILMLIITALNLIVRYVSRNKMGQGH